MPNTIPSVTSKADASRLRGYWQGFFGNNRFPTSLEITETKDASFSGKMSVEQNGKSSCQIRISGEITDSAGRNLHFHEVQASSATWKLGHEEGTINSDGNSMSGTETDGEHGTGPWSFHKVDSLPKQKTSVPLKPPVQQQDIMTIGHLTSADLIGKSSWDLDLLRNEIYARHGLRFHRQDLRHYFEGQTWYRPTIDNPDTVEKSFSATERDNASIIHEYQKEHMK